MSHDKKVQGRPTWAEINLGALANNFRVVKAIIGRDVAVMAVVKANAYGHGAVECARRLAREGADWFGVAILEEAITLRESGIKEPILVLGGIWPGQEEASIKYHLTPVIYRFDRLKSLERAVRAARMQIDVHIKIDTGMGRLGLRAEIAGEFADQIKNQIDPALIRVDGLMTHFAAADDPAKEDFTKTQIDKFRHAVKVFHDRGLNPTFKNLANTPGIYTQPEARGNMVRAGGILYGLWRDILPTSFI
ncbi:MAG: alanine racemase, partial [Pyrinomonadaceae bacterium]